MRAEGRALCALRLAMRVQGRELRVESQKIADSPELRAKRKAHGAMRIARTSYCLYPFFHLTLEKS